MAELSIESGQFEELNLYIQYLQLPQASRSYYAFHARRLVGAKGNRQPGYQKLPQDQPAARRTRCRMRILREPASQFILGYGRMFKHGQALSTAHSVLRFRSNDVIVDLYIYRTAPHLFWYCTCYYLVTTAKRFGAIRFDRI